MHHLRPILAKLTILSVFLLPFALLTTDVQAVRNGIPANHYPKTIFAFNPASGGIGTATNVKYERCFVTADHVLQPNRGGRGKVVAGWDGRAAFIQPQYKDQDVAPGRFGSVPNAAPGSPYYDIGVFWVQNELDDGANLRIQAGRDYSPMAMGDAQSLGLSNATNLVDPQVVSPEPPVPITIVGYGLNDSTFTNTPLGPFPDGDIGDGFKRLGSPRAVAYYERGDGSAFRVWETPGDGTPARIACGGDSGGPMISNGTTYGVVSMATGYPNQEITHTSIGFGGFCVQEKLNVFTGFNMIPGPEKGNYEKTMELIENICQKTLYVSVTGEGKVTGDVLAANIGPSTNNDLNSSIDCGTTSAVGDCHEFMHEAQQATLTAVPGPDHRFSHWSDSPLAQPTTAFCPCNNSTTAICTVTYPSMGFYAPFMSLDRSHCVAHFVPVECGDNTVDAGEECDYDSAVEEETSVCDNDCTAVACGDSVLNETAGEECDDGNTDIGDGCDTSCEIEEDYCGDGELQTGEECDAGMDTGEAVETSSCDIDCSYAVCGDEYVNEPAGEQCDDGNDDAGDGCSAACIEEICGNGLLDPGEQCDEGDEDTETCNADCTAPVCGDGVTSTFEECDDENVDDGDGCSSSCKIEDNSCGDGNLDSGEECESDVACPAGSGLICYSGHCKAPSDVLGPCQTQADCGPLPDFSDPTVCHRDVSHCDGQNCVLQDMGSCPAGTQCTTDVDCGAVEPTSCSDACLCEAIVCGDGEVATETEECDDGNTDDNDGCSAACEWEELCGDDTIDDGEECDDGNVDDNDGCSAVCTEEVCGDNIVQENEECDDGNTDDNDGCNASCMHEACGDGVQDSLEECDDGNAVNGDGCSDGCMVEYCGNGIVEGGEICDEGGFGATCDDDCTLAQCGDGDLNPDAGEECDDGNTDDTDECNNACEDQGPCGALSISCQYGAAECCATNQWECPANEEESACEGGGSSSSAPSEQCGNSITETGEECDDGNTDIGDGCNGTCQEERGDCSVCDAAACAACMGGGDTCYATWDDPSNTVCAPPGSIPIEGGMDECGC